MTAPLCLFDPPSPTDWHGWVQSVLADAGRWYKLFSTPCMGKRKYHSWYHLCTYLPNSERHVVDICLRLLWKKALLYSLKQETDTVHWNDPLQMSWNMTPIVKIRHIIFMMSAKSLIMETNHLLLPLMWPSEEKSVHMSDMIFLISLWLNQMYWGDVEILQNRLMLNMWQPVLWWFIWQMGKCMQIKKVGFLFSHLMLMRQ